MHPDINAWQDPNVASRVNEIGDLCAMDTGNPAGANIYDFGHAN